MRVEPLSGSRLVSDLLAGRPEATGFYTGHPHDLAAYAEKLAEVRGRFDRAARERAAAALRPASPGAEARLRRFVEEGGAVVTTGQQAGLFTGPLYTVHKILTAIRLAQALERELGIIVLPVFWVASEDHDFAEVNHAYAVTPDGELHRSAVSATTDVPVPMSEMRLGDAVHTASGEFLQTVSADDDNRNHLTSILSAYQPGATVSEAFLDTIIRLFSGFDLCVTDAADEAVKRGSAGVLLAEAEHAAEHERLVAERTERLAAAGYPPPVTVMEGATNLFYRGPAGRERLYRDGESLVARESRRHFSRDDLRRLLEEEPGALSPNVFLRPVVESAVFPTLAYVGGPAETAYFGQIQPLFESLGIRPPIAFPRFSATITPEEVERAQVEAGIERDELFLPEHELWEVVARRHLPPEVADSIGYARAALVDVFVRVIEASVGIDPNLEPAIGARRDRALLEAAKAERTILRHFKRSRADLERAVRLTRNHLRPLGLPQERVLTVFQYLGREPRLLHLLAEGMEIPLRSAASSDAAAQEMAPAGTGT